VERSSHFAFPVLLSGRQARDRFRAELAELGVQTTWYPALHLFTEYRHLEPVDGLPRATEAANRHCALPLSATMDEAAVELVTEAIRSVLTSHVA
jgi:dTDP-4-amino-4,6-dideoxygalactose transaminase